MVEFSQLCSCEVGPREPGICLCSTPPSPRASLTHTLARRFSAPSFFCRPRKGARRQHRAHVDFHAQRRGRRRPNGCVLRARLPPKGQGVSAGVVGQRWVRALEEPANEHGGEWAKAFFFARDVPENLLHAGRGRDPLAGLVQAVGKHHQVFKGNDDAARARRGRGRRRRRAAGRAPALE